MTGMCVKYSAACLSSYTIQHSQEMLHVQKLKVQAILYLTLMLLMSYVYMEHPFLMFLDHTQRRSTVGRTPLDE